MADQWGAIYRFDSPDDMSIRLRRLERGRQTERRGSLITPSSDYVSMPSVLLEGSQINLASAGVLAQGSIAPFTLQGKFAFTATTTTITVYWDGTNGSELLALLRTSGQVIAIPGNSLTVSGLTPDTTYGFLPYRSVFNDCGPGWIIGDAGSPQFAFTAAAQTNVALAQQQLQGREQLTTGFITYKTPAAGTSSGGGGGGGACVMLGTDIETLGDIPYSTKHHQQNEWVRIEAEDYPRGLNCTPDHPLFSPSRGKADADSFSEGDWIITDWGEKKVTRVESFLRVCTKVQVEMAVGHLFWANGYLSHNNKWAQP